MRIKIKVEGDGFEKWKKKDKKNMNCWEIWVILWEIWFEFEIWDLKISIELDILLIVKENKKKLFIIFLWLEEYVINILPLFLINKFY
jgi:hypothetical protein